MLNTVSIGDIGESVAIMKFTYAQCNVSKPLTNNAKYDLIIDIKNKLYRVQVKTTQLIKDQVKMDFAMKTTNYSKGNWVSNGYNSKEIDLFFLYCLENNWCGLYIVDNDQEIPKNISIRLSPPKNNQVKGVNLAENFEFNKQFTLLI